MSHHALTMSVRRRIVSVVAVAGVFGIGALGGTAWASLGPGSGHGSTEPMRTVTLSATAGTPSTLLYPGGTGDVSLEVNNPNPFAVTLVGVTGTGTITPDAAHSSCTTTGVTFKNQTGLSTTIPGGVGDYRIDLPRAASMSASSSNGCQGATFSVPVAITVQR